MDHIPRLPQTGVVGWSQQERYKGLRATPHASDTLLLLLILIVVIITIIITFITIIIIIITLPQVSGQAHTSHVSGVKLHAILAHSKT